MRDISIIETPPEGRRPIRTTVGEYDEELVKLALEREDEREGQAFYLHNRVETIEERGRAAAAALPGAPLPRRARADAREGARGADARVPARRRRRARLDDDHRVGDRHPAGEHADRRARRHARPRPALPDPRPRRPLRRDRVRVPLLSRRARADAGGAGAARDARRPHRARRRLRDRDARPRDPRRRRAARRGAVGPRRRRRLRALRRAAERGGRRAAGPAARRGAARCGSTRAIDAYVPQQYVDSEALRIDIHRRLALAETEDELRELQASLEDRYGPLPEPVENLFAIQEAKIKVALLGADYLVFRGGKATVGRLVLGSGELQELRDRVHTAVYAVRKQEVSLRERGRIPPSASAGRCYLGGAPGSVRPPSPLPALPATSTSLDGNEDCLRFLLLLSLLVVLARRRLRRRRRRRASRPTPSPPSAATPITKAQFNVLIDGAKRAYKAQQQTPFPKAGHRRLQELQDQAMQFLVQQDGARAEGQGPRRDRHRQRTSTTQIAQIKKQYFGGSEEKYQAR